MVRDLSLDRPDGGLGCYGREVGIQFGRRKDGIDIVALKSFGRREREAGPDY